MAIFVTKYTHEAYTYARFKKARLIELGYKYIVLTITKEDHLFFTSNHMPPLANSVLTIDEFKKQVDKIVNTRKIHFTFKT